jgi:hypothetical protein
MMITLLETSTALLASVVCVASVGSHGGCVFRRDNEDSMSFASFQKEIYLQS